MANLPRHDRAYVSIGPVTPRHSGGIRRLGIWTDRPGSLAGVQSGEKVRLSTGAITCRAVEHWGLSLFLALGFALTGSIALPIPTAEADGHGVTVPIAQGVYGTYEYVVAVFPAEPVVGPLYVAVKLTSESVPVTAAEVLVTGSVGGIQKNTAPAVPDPHEPGSYEIEMVLNQSGAWTFEIEIDGPLGMASIETGGSVGS